jgi:hypothetical protein
MGRIVDLCGEIAATAEEGDEGLVIPPDVYNRLRDDWEEDDINDALGLVHDSLLQSELIDSAESLSRRLVDILGTFADPLTFKEAQGGEGRVGLEVLAQLVRRVQRMEEILEAYREDPGPERTSFDALHKRLRDAGIEDQMDDPHLVSYSNLEGHERRRGGDDDEE